MAKHLVCIVLLFILSYLSYGQKAGKPIPIIFDTDMGPDYDDVGAITILHAMADSGQVNILATVASTNYEGVAAVLNIFNTYFKRPNTAIGVPKGNAVKQKDWQHWTDSLLAKYPHNLKYNNEVPDAIGVYRKALAGQPDHSVTIVTVGFLTNLAGLLHSTGDQYSSLSGADLVNLKVKQLVCMAGRFPMGSEFNVRMDAPASKYVFENWGTPIIFSGFEIGANITTGIPLIHNVAIKNDPVKDVFSICIPKAAEDSAGRKSWDETAVLVAIKGYEPWYRLEEGRIEVATDGSNAWNGRSKGQFRLVENLPPSVMQDLVNRLIMHQPSPHNYH